MIDDLGGLSQHRDKWLMLVPWSGRVGAKIALNTDQKGRSPDSSFSVTRKPGLCCLVCFLAVFSQRECDLRLRPPLAHKGADEEARGLVC